MFTLANLIFPNSDQTDNIIVVMSLSRAADVSMIKILNRVDRIKMSSKLVYQFAVKIILNNTSIKVPNN